MGGLFETILIFNFFLMAGILIAVFVGIWRLIAISAQLGRTLETTQALLKDLHEQVVPVLESTKGALKNIDAALHEEVRPLLGQTGKSVAEVQVLLASLNGKIQPLARAIGSAKRLPQAAVLGGITLKNKLTAKRTQEAVVPSSEAAQAIVAVDEVVSARRAVGPQRLAGKLLRRKDSGE